MRVLPLVPNAVSNSLHCCAEAAIGALPVRPTLLPTFSAPCALHSLMHQVVCLQVGPAAADAVNPLLFGLRCMYIFAYDTRKVILLCAGSGASRCGRRGTATDRAP